MPDTDTTEEETIGIGRKVGIAAILLAGVASIGWSIPYVWPEEQPPAMSPDQFKETLKAADKRDRENWDKMWRDAGKTPPPVGK